MRRAIQEDDQAPLGITLEVSSSNEATTTKISLCTLLSSLVLCSLPNQDRVQCGGNHTLKEREQTAAKETMEVVYTLGRLYAIAKVPRMGSRVSLSRWLTGSFRSTLNSS